MGRNIFIALIVVAVAAGLYLFLPEGGKQQNDKLDTGLDDQPTVEKTTDKSEKNPDEVSPIEVKKSTSTISADTKAPDLIADEKAEQPTWLDGTVRDAEKKPIAGATVMIVTPVYKAPGLGKVVMVKQFVDTVISQATTDENGHYVMKDLQPGKSYELRASAPGFMLKRKDGIKVGTRADFTLLPGAEVVGRLEDSKTGEPIVGALVRGYYRTPAGVRRVSQAFRWTEHATTDDKGNFRFNGVPARTVKFLIWHDDYEDFAADRNIRQGTTDRPVFKLNKGLCIAGIVKDKISGQPIENLDVQVTATLIPQHKAKTDANGRFILRGVARSPQRFAFSRDGYTQTTEVLTVSDKNDFDPENPEESRMLSFEVEPTGSASGILVDESGVPLANAKIFVAGKNPLTYPVRGQAESITDANGAFLVKNLGANKIYRVAAHKDGYAIGHSEDFSVKAAEHRDDLRLSLGRGAAIRGRVLDEVGTPIANAELICQKPPYSGVWFPPGLTIGQQGTLSVLSDPEGAYEIDALWPGTYTITVSHPAHVGLKNQKVILSAANAIKQQDFTMKIGRFIAGMVTSSEGELPAGVQVTASQPWSDQVAGSATVDKDGFYRITGLVGGEYRVQAKGEGFTSNILWQVPADTDNANLMLVRPGEIVGVAMSSSGEPVSQFTVQLYREDVGLPEEMRQKAAASTSGRAQTFGDEGGQFRMTDVDPGTYTALFTSPSCSRVERKHIVVSNGGPTDLGAITMPKGATIRGVVLDKSGNPIRHATFLALNISLQQQLRERNRNDGEASLAPPKVQWTIQTREDGSFQIGGLPAGNYRCSVRCEDYVAMAQDDFKVEAGAEVVKNYTLSRAATVTFRVRDNYNQPVISAYARVNDAATGRVVRMQGVARTNAQGEMDLKGLGPGNYRIFIQRTGYLSTEVAVTVEEGATTTHDVTLEKLR